VKFDKEYGYGDAEDEFKNLCKTVGELKSKFLIGEVRVLKHCASTRYHTAQLFRLASKTMAIRRTMTCARALV
jgi:hypothetical protein